MVGEIKLSAWTELTLLEQLDKKGCPDIAALKKRAANRIRNLENWNKEMYENHRIEIAKLNVEIKNGGRNQHEAN